MAAYEYQALDGKGRIIVPLPFRADLGKTF